MATTKLAPKFDSSQKNIPLRGPNIANNFSNWNKLLNNVNVVVKNTKQISEKVEVKEKIIDKYSLKDTNLSNINNQIEKKSLVEKSWIQKLLTATGTAGDGKDDESRKRLQNIILQNIEKNDLDRSLEYLRKQYRYYRYLQHQEIVYVEKMRLQKINEKKSWSGYLRSIGPPIVVTIGLAGAVIGINLLFVTNISGLPFWITLCEKMVNSKFNKVIFEATINVMSSFGLFTSKEVVTLRTLYSSMLVQVSSSEFKNSGANIENLAKKVFSSTEKYEKPDSTKQIINFFEYIKSSLESKNIYNTQSKSTLSAIGELKNKVLKSASGIESTTIDPTTGEPITSVLPSSIGLEFVRFVYENYNSPVFKWSFSMLGISFNLFKFVNISIDKIISHPNSNSIIIFKDLTRNILNSYTGNQLLTFISTTVSDMPSFIGDQITTSNIEYFLSPATAVIDKISPIGSSAAKYISPITDYISPVVDIISEIKSYVTSYLLSYINYTQKEITDQITKLTVEQTKIKKDVDDDTNTNKIFASKINEILEKYNNISICLLKNPENVEEIKKCYKEFIEFVISLYQTDKGENVAPKILENTLKIINEKSDIQSMKSEMDKLFNYYSGVFVSENVDKLSDINNRLKQNKSKLLDIKQKKEDLDRTLINNEITETHSQLESLKLIPEKVREIQESSEKIKEKFKNEFSYEELYQKINNFNKCFDKQTVDDIKSCYKVLTNYIIDSANDEVSLSSDVEKSFVQKLKDKMVDIDKITDITELRKEGKSIIYDVNTYFVNPLTEVISESIISKKKKFDRIGKTQKEIDTLDKKEAAFEKKRNTLFEQSQKKIQQQRTRIEHNINKKQFFHQKISLEQESKKKDIINNVDEIIKILGTVSKDVDTEINNNNNLIAELNEVPFDEFKKNILSKISTAKTGIEDKSKSYRILLQDFIDKYSDQIKKLSDSKIIDESEKNNLESIVNKIKIYRDSILNTNINIYDDEFSEITNYIDEYNGSLNLFFNKSFTNNEFDKFNTIDTFIQDNINDVITFLNDSDVLLNDTNTVNDYNIINKIIQEGIEEGNNENEIIEKIITKLSDNIDKEFDNYNKIIEDFEKGISKLEYDKKMSEQLIVDAKVFIEELNSKKNKINESLKEIKSNKEKILSLKYAKTPFSSEEIEKLDKIKNLEKINKGLSEELLKISVSIKETTAKFNKPVADIKSELKKIRLESGILDATIKDKDTSFLGQFSSDGFFKGLVKSNVNMYLHTNKNKMVDMFFDKFTDENDAKAYKEKITTVKKNQISLIEEEVLYMSKIGKGRTTKEIKNILYASKVAVNNNPLNFRSPITKFVATLYSSFNGFLNDPTTMMYACFSSSFLQNIFTKSFMTTFFGGLAVGGSGLLVQDSVLKDTFYMKFEFKDNWMKNIAYNWLGLGEISDFIIDKMFGSEISFRSLLVSVLTLIIGNDSMLNMRVQTFLNNLVQDIIYDFNILFTRLSSIIFYSKSVQSVYGYIESILGVWLTGSFKISAKMSYKLLLLPSISNNLKNKIPKKIELIKIINDPKKFGSLCQFINYKMYNIVNYAKKLQISDIFMQFTDLKDTIFLENVNTFLDTDDFFQIQKYDPTKSISNLNGNIITLTDKLTSNIEEYIIIDNDSDNFKLIQTSKISELIKNKLKDIEEPNILVGGMNDSIMKYLLLYYVNEFKNSKEYSDEFEKLNTQYKNESEYNEKFEIPFNDFLVKEASKLYKNGNPDLISYSLTNRLITLLAENKEHNKKIIVDNKEILQNNEGLPENDKQELRTDFFNSFWDAKTSVIDSTNFPAEYITKLHSAIVDTKISSKKEDEEVSEEPQEKKETPETETETKELTPDNLIETMSIKDLFDSQSVQDIVLFVPYYDIFSKKINYKKKYVDFRDYLKISQQLLFSMNDETNIQITKDQIERLEALQAKTKDSYLTEAIENLNSKFSENFNELKDVRLNFENSFRNALQKGYIQFSSLGLDTNFFIQNLLNFNLADSKGYENNKEILDESVEILKIESEFKELNSQLDSLTYTKKQLEENKTKRPDINVDNEIDQLTQQITEKNTEITKKSGYIDEKKKYLSELKRKYIEKTLFGKTEEKMTEEEKNMKQYICFITGTISQLIDKCETSNEEIVKLMLKPENLLTLNNPKHNKNEQLTSRTVSKNIDYQKKKTENELQAITNFQKVYNESIDEIDREIEGLSNFLKETLRDPACDPPNNVTKTVQEFIYSFQLSKFEKKSEVTMDDDNLCELFKTKFKELTTKLESLDEKMREFEEIKLNFISKISAEKITDEKIKKEYINFIDKIRNNKFISLNEIDSAIDETYGENTVDKLTLKYLNFLSGISSYHKATKDTLKTYVELPSQYKSDSKSTQLGDDIKAQYPNDSHPNLSFSIINGWFIKPLIPKMRSGNVSGINHSNEDMSQILAKFSTFLKDDVQPYMTDRIASLQTNYTDSLKTEDENGAKLKQAKTMLYNYLKGFNIIDNKIGSDINKNILHSIVYTVNDMTRRGDSSASPNKFDNKNILITTDNILYNFKGLIENILENSNANENSYSDLYDYLSDNIKNVNPEIKELVTNFDEMVASYKSDKLFEEIKEKCSIKIKKEDKDKPKPKIKNTKQNIDDVNEYISKSYVGSYNGSIKIKFSQKIGDNDVFDTNLYYYSSLSKINPELVDLQREAVIIEDELNTIAEQVRSSREFDEEIGQTDGNTIAVCGQIENYYNSQQRLFATQKLMLEGYSKFFFSEQIYNVDNKYTHFVDQSSLVFSKFSADVNKVYKKFVENYKESREPEDFSGILPPVIPIENEEKEEDTTTSTGPSQQGPQGPGQAPLQSQQQQQQGQKQDLQQAKSNTAIKVTKTAQEQKESEEQAKARLKESIKQDLANKLSNELRSSQAEAESEDISLRNDYGGDSNDSSLFSKGFGALANLLSTDMETDALEILPTIKSADDTKGTTAEKPESSFEKCSRIQKLWKYEGNKLIPDDSITKQEAEECSRINLTEKYAMKIKSGIVSYLGWIFSIIETLVNASCAIISTSLTASKVGATWFGVGWVIPPQTLIWITGICAFIKGMLQAENCFPKLINFFVYKVLANYSSNTNKEDINTNNIVTKYAKILLFHSITQDEEQENKKAVNQFGVKLDGKKWCDTYIVPFFKSYTGNIKDQTFDMIKNDLKNSDYLKEKYNSVLNFQETDIYGHINEGAPVAFDEEGALSIIDLFKELEVDNVIDKTTIEELKNKNVQDFLCPDYERLHSYKMVLLLALNRPGNLMTYLLGKFFCNIFGTPNPDLKMLAGSFFYTIANSINLLICNNKIRIFEFVCNTLFQPVLSTLERYGGRDIVPKVVAEFVSASSEILQLPLARKYILNELLGSPSTEKNTNFARDIIEEHLKAIDKKINSAKLEGKSLSFKTILSKEINNGLSKLCNDVIRELTTFMSSNVPKEKKEITNDFKPWVDNLNSNIYSLLDYSTTELNEFVFYFGQEIEKEFDSFINENKENPNKDELETILGNIKNTLGLINNNNINVEKNEADSKKYYEELKQQVTNFENKLDKKDPLYEMKKLIVPQIQEIIDGLLKFKDSKETRDVLVQKQFNNNNKTSSGLSGLIEKLSVNPIYINEKDLDMWLSPCEDNQVLQDVTFDKISCIEIVSPEDEKKLLGDDDKFEKINFENRIKYFIEDFNAGIELKNNKKLHDLVFAIYGLPDKSKNTDEELFEFIKLNLLKLDEDLKKIDDPLFVEQIKKFKDAKKLFLLETNYYGQTNEDGKYENFLKSDKSTLIEQRSKKEDEKRAKLAQYIEKYTKKMSLSNKEEIKNINNEIDEINEEIDKIDKEIDYFSGEIKKNISSENNIKNEFFHSIRLDTNQGLIFNSDDNNFYKKQISLNQNDSPYLFYLFRNKYKKIFNTIPDVKLIHSCVKILSDESYNYDNLPENIISEIITRNNENIDKDKYNKETIENLIISILSSNKETTPEIKDIIKNIITNEDNKNKFEQYLRMIIIKKSKKITVSVNFKKPGKMGDGKIIYGENGEIKNIENPEDFFEIIYPSLFNNDEIPEGEQYNKDLTEFFNSMSQIQNLGYNLSTQIYDDKKNILFFKVTQLNPYIVRNSGDELKKTKIDYFNQKITESNNKLKEKKKELLEKITVLDNKRIADKANDIFKKYLQDPNSDASQLKKFLEENTEGIIEDRYNELTGPKKIAKEELQRDINNINLANNEKLDKIDEKYKEIATKITGTSKIITNLVPVPKYIEEYNNKIDEINAEIQELRNKADEKNDASACSNASITKAKADNKSRSMLNFYDYEYNQKANCKAAEDELKKKNGCEYNKDEKNTPLTCKSADGYLISGSESNKYILAMNIAIAKNNNAREAEKKLANTEKNKRVTEKQGQINTLITQIEGEVKAKKTDIDNRKVKQAKYDNYMEKYKLGFKRTQENSGFAELVDFCINANFSDGDETVFPYKKEAEKLKAEFVAAEKENNDDKIKNLAEIDKIDPEYNKQFKVTKTGKYLLNKGTDVAVGAVNLMLKAKNKAVDSFNGVNIFAESDYIFPKEITAPTILFIDESSWGLPVLNLNDLKTYKEEKEAAKINNMSYIIKPEYEFIIKYYIETDKKNADGKKLFLFKPDIELYKREFSDFDLNDFENNIIYSMDKNIFFNYFHERKIVGRSEKIEQNEDNQNFLLNQMPFNIFSSKNIYLYWNLNASDDNNEPIVKNFISLVDMKDSKVVPSEVLQGSMIYTT